MKYIALVVLIITLLFPKSINAAFNLYPSNVDFGQLEAGKTYSKEVFITRTFDAATQFTLEPIFSSIKDWVTIEPKVISFTGSERVSTFNINVEVPADALQESYNGSVRVSELGSEDEGLLVVAGQRVAVQMDIGGTESRDLTISDLAVEDQTVGQPIKVSFKAVNNTDQKITPDEVRLVLATLDGEVLEDMTQNPRELIQGNSSKVLSEDFNSKLGKGEYMATITINYKGKALSTDRALFRFTGGSVAGASTTADAAGTFGRASLILVILGIVSLAGLSFINIRRRKQKTNSSEHHGFRRIEFVTAFILSIVLLVLGMVLYIAGSKASGGEIIDVKNLKSLLTSGSSQVKGAATEVNENGVKTLLIPSHLPETDIYEHSDIKSNKMTTIEGGEAYELIDENSQWYRIILPNGRPGWVAKNSLE